MKVETLDFSKTTAFGYERQVRDSLFVIRINPRCLRCVLVLEGSAVPGRGWGQYFSLNTAVMKYKGTDTVFLFFILQMKFS